MHVEHVSPAEIRPQRMQDDAVAGRFEYFGHAQLCEGKQPADDAIPDHNHTDFSGRFPLLLLSGFATSALFCQSSRARWGAAWTRVSAWARPLLQGCPGQRPREGEYGLYRDLSLVNRACHALLAITSRRTSRAASSMASARQGCCIAGPGHFPYSSWPRAPPWRPRPCQ